MRISMNADLGGAAQDVLLGSPLANQQQRLYFRKSMEN